jgi:hypothetical protein
MRLHVLMVLRSTNVCVDMVLVGLGRTSCRRSRYRRSHRMTGAWRWGRSRSTSDGSWQTRPAGASTTMSFPES